MKILTTTLGFVLIFEATKDLEGVIKHLQGMLEWVESEDISPPHLYACRDERISKEDIEDLLNKLKISHK